MSDTTPGPGAGAGTAGTAATAGTARPTQPQEGDQSWLGRALAAVPAVLSSKVHILWLFVLLLWIVILAVPFPGIASARIELILGNYTNVTSALGACIAAGGTMALAHHAKRESKLAEERHQMTQEVHQLLRLAHPEHAATLDSARAASGTQPDSGARPATVTQPDGG